MTTFGFGASLAVRQRRASSATFDFAGAMPAGAVLTRGSAATRFDASGVLVGAAANVARFDYDPATLALRGLLIEAAATNVLLSSEAFDAAAWTIAGATVAANAAAAPSAAASADKLIETSANSQHRIQQSIATTSGQTYSLSVFVKPVERTAIWLRLNAATAFATATFDLTAQTMTGVTGSATISALANGWLRLSVTGVADAAATIAYLNLIDAGGTGTYAGTGSAGLLLWGAQVEAGSATSYIATTSAAASRAADAVTLNWGGLGAADGTPTVRYTFDDGSTQDVTTAIAGGFATVPTTLARARMRRAAVA